MRKAVKILIIFTITIIISIIIINILTKNKKIIVCIDAGHGGTDVGAVLDNRYEKNDTLEISKLVKQYLEEQNIDVILTRNTDETIGLRDRCKIANRKFADIFVSIHRNSSEDSEANGIEIWTSSQKKKNDIELAEMILNHLENIEMQNNRGIKHGTIKGENTNYYVLSNTNMPSCLIELGFISNDKDNELFDKNIEAYAKAIADGIIEKTEVDG